MNIQHLLFPAVAMMVVGMFLVSGNFGYERTQHIANIPCLGCLALDPSGIKDFTFDTVNDKPHADLILDTLEKQVIFLHFRTDACPGCDEIEPTIYDIDDEYPEVAFAHINLDHEGDFQGIQLDKGEEMDLYGTYDLIQEEKGRPGGVPMMTIITLNMDHDGDGTVKPFYVSLYGAGFDHDDFRKILDDSIDLHGTYVDAYIAGK